MRSPGSPLFSRLNKPCSLGLSSQHECSSPQPLRSGDLPLLDLLWLANVCPVQRSQNWIQQLDVVGRVEKKSCCCRPGEHAPVHRAREAAVLLCCQGTLLALVLAVPRVPFSSTAPQPGSPQPVALRGTLPSQVLGSVSVLVEFREGFLSPHSCSLSRSP